MPVIGINRVRTAINDLVVERNKQVKGIFFTGLSRIQIAAAVDEGRFRNNWFFSTDIPSSDITDATSWNELSISEFPFWVLDKPMYYTNNLPYAETLEYGLYTGVGDTGKTVASAGGIYSTQYVGGAVRTELIKVRRAIKELRD